MGAVLGERPVNQILLHAKCGPSEPCLRSDVSLGPEIWPFFGGLGAISSVGDRFFPTDKKIETRKNVDRFIFCYGSNEPLLVENILPPVAPYRGRAQ